MAGGVLLILYLSTGVHQVKVQETGVLTRFGKIDREHIDPGICITWPWPIERLETVRTRAIETLQAGFGGEPEPGEAWGRKPDPEGQARKDTLTIPYVISGDKNVLHLKVLVNYRIADPTLYRFGVRNGEAILALLAQEAILAFVSQAHVDQLLTSGKLELRDFIQGRLNKVLGDVRLGVEVVSVEARHVHPPGPTTQAFKDVINAQEESREQVHQAESYANRVLPEALGEAGRILSEAEAYRTRVVAAARGEAVRFELLAGQYVAFPDVTRERLRQEAIELMLPAVSKVLVGSSGEAPAATLRFLTERPRR